MNALLSCSLEPYASEEPIRGLIEGVTEGVVSGWCVDLGRPAEALRLEVRVGGVLLGEAVARQDRGDIGALIGGPALAGFSFELREVPSLLLGQALSGLQEMKDEELLVVCLPSGPRLAAMDGGVTVETLKAQLQSCVVDSATAVERPILTHEGESPKVLRESILARPGFKARAIPAQGCVDGFYGPFLAGWVLAESERGAHGPAEVVEPAVVEVLEGGVLVGLGLANEYRSDVAAAGKGDGACGFRVALPPALLQGQPLDLQVRARGLDFRGRFQRGAVVPHLRGQITRIDHDTVYGSVTRPVEQTTTLVQLWCDDVCFATFQDSGPFRVEVPSEFFDGRPHHFLLATNEDVVVLADVIATTPRLDRWEPTGRWFDLHSRSTPADALPPRILELAERIASSVLFDAARYARQAGVNFARPLEAAVHYLRSRTLWSTATSDWVDPAFVAASAAPVAAGACSPLEWYFQQPLSADVGPTAFFSNVDYALLSGRSLDAPLDAPSLFDEWLEAAKSRPIAPSVLVSPEWLLQKSTWASVGEALAAWQAMPPQHRKAGDLHPYFDDDWLAQHSLLQQRSIVGCAFTAFRLGLPCVLPPHPILDRARDVEGSYYQELRTYELSYLQRRVHTLSRLCPHIDVGKFEEGLLGVQDVSGKSPLYRYAAGDPSQFRPSFLSYVDEKFVSAQYPGLLEYCLNHHGTGDVNKIASRWLRPLGVPTNWDDALHPPAGMLTLQELHLLRNFRPVSVATPKVSFLIPSYGRDDLVLRCVLSALHTPSARETEFVVAEDACHIDGSWILGYFLPFLKVTRNAVNLGFLRNCNAAVPNTKGEVVLLVNNDVIVHRDAVDELLIAFDRFPRAGVVGGLVLNKDGSIQENGGLLWRDASAWNYHRGRDAAGEFLFNTRCVDYVSGCWIAIRRRVWDEVGAFDERFAPAYCEESDFCLAARARGYDVMVAPHSVVTHLDGATMGQDESGQTLKAYQRINRQKMASKWRHVLASHNGNGDVSAFHAGFDDGSRSIVLVFDHYIPEPDRDAGSRTVYAMLETLSAMPNIHVVFIPMNNARSRYARPLERMGIEIISGKEGWAWFDHLLQSFKHRVKHVLVSRTSVAEHFSWHLAQLDCTKSIYIHDVEALRAFPAEASESLGEVLVQRAMALYADRFRGTLSKFDVVVSCSPEETSRLEQAALGPVVELFPYNREPSPTKGPASARKDFLFVGSYNHPPNREALEHLLARLWPEVRRALPQASLHVCGAGFENALLGHQEGVFVHGQVTDSTLDYLYGLSRVAVVPLVSGAGIKGKVVEACAHGVCPVGTRVAWQGLEVPPGFESLSGDLGTMAGRMLELYARFDEDASRAMVEFYERIRRRRSIGDVIPQLVQSRRRR